MKLIAVMDLMAGQVVHARRGRRDAYLPLRSALCDGCDAVTVAEALLALHPFHALYLADLDAILHRGDNRAAIARLRRALPDVPLWVDAGIGHAGALQRFRAAGLGTAVIGSETLEDLRLLDGAAGGQDVILSLDFKAGAFLGPAQLATSAERWPRRIVAMNLDRVGSGSGPDLALLATLRLRRSEGEIFAAGGIRSHADVDAAGAAGAAGVLLASALHDRSLSAGDLKDFA